MWTGYCINKENRDIITPGNRFAQWVLENRGGRAIRGRNSRDSKKWKKIEKGVDKWRKVWYSNQAVREMRGAADRNLKKFKKTVDKRKTVCYNLKVAADKRQPSEWKKLKKLLDKRSRVWYNKKVAEYSDGPEKVKKLWKKFLTNGMKSCIIAMFRRKRRVPCKLNNVTKRKHQTERFPVRNHGGSGQEVAKYEVVNSSER